MNDYISKTGRLSKSDLILESQKKNISVPKGDHTFGHILSEQIGKTLPTEEQKQPSGLLELQSPLNLSFTDTSFDPQKYAGKLEASLDLLETYAAFLNDPDKTLKQASELLDQILDQIQGMEQDLKSANAPDSDINQILNQILTTASLEKIKLDRGDYLN